MKMNIIRIIQMGEYSLPYIITSVWSVIFATRMTSFTKSEAQKARLKIKTSSFKEHMLRGQKSRINLRGILM